MTPIMPINTANTKAKPRCGKEARLFNRLLNGLYIMACASACCRENVTDASASARVPNFSRLAPAGQRFAGELYVYSTTA
jgi:hypothetical protein